MIKESACHGNVAVFKYLLFADPILPGTWNRTVESILVTAMTSGVEIWRIILEYEPC